MLSAEGERLSAVPRAVRSSLEADMLKATPGRVIRVQFLSMETKGKKTCASKAT